VKSSDLHSALDCLGAIAEGTAQGGSFARHGVASLTRLVVIPAIAAW